MYRSFGGYCHLKIKSSIHEHGMSFHVFRYIKFLSIMFCVFKVQVLYFFSVIYSEIFILFDAIVVGIVF